MGNIKIYSDDPSLPYKTTRLKALYTKSEIDGLFAKWGIKDVYWHWDPEHHDIIVQFKINEDVNGVPLNVSAKVEAPIIWDHKTRSKAEDVNWNISMRVMFWFIKSHLEAAYLLQSSKIAAFLPYLASKNGGTLSDEIIPRLIKDPKLTVFKVKDEPKIEIIDVEEGEVTIEQI